MICTKENIKIDKNKLQNLIESSGSDLRQIINVIQMWKNNQSVGCRNLDMDKIAKDEKVMINNFDAAFRLLNINEHQSRGNYTSFRDKLDLFFIDYEFVPLLVQENYLNAFGDRNSMRDIE